MADFAIRIAGEPIRVNLGESTAIAARSADRAEAAATEAEGIKSELGVVLNEWDLIMDANRPLFVPTWEYTKSHKIGAASQSFAILSRDSASQFTVAAGKGSTLAVDGSVAIYDASADRYTSHGIIAIAGDTVTVADTLPATCSTCEPMHDAVNGQHLSRHGYRGLADFIASYSRRFGFRKSSRLFAYHPPITRGIAFNNPDIYALDGVTNVIDVDTLGGAAGGGYVTGTTDLPRACAANSADTNITQQSLTNYLSRAYLVQDSGAGKGIQFSFAGKSVDGFMEIPIAAARVSYASGSQTTTGRVRLEVLADGNAVFDQAYTAGKPAYIFDQRN